MSSSSWVIIGAGAIGGLMGAKLALAGDADVTLVARGPHLEAMQAKGGITIVDKDGVEKLCKNVLLAPDLNALRGQTFDVIVLAVKSHQIAPVAKDLELLCHADSVILPVQNGLPWWYFYQNNDPKFEGITLKSLDPTGELSSIKLERIIGCIAFAAAEISSPGVIKHIEGRAFPLGEPDRSISDRAVRISMQLEKAGFKAPVRKDFREEIWLKLLGNICYNPISALTGAFVGEIAIHPVSEQLCRNCMMETQAVANKLGCELRLSIDKRIEGGKKVGDHQTSMLQDVLKSKIVEVELLSALVEMADLVQMEIPAIKTLHALIVLLNQVIQKRGSIAGKSRL